MRFMRMPRRSVWPFDESFDQCRARDAFAFRPCAPRGEGGVIASGAMAEGGGARVPRAGDVLAGDRRALAAAITLFESTRDDDRAAAEGLLDTLLAHSGKTVRVGVSGAPGVGKSTFIEALGGRLVERGHRVAVLAVDPSSARSGGSILGDKTRMAGLARDERSFVRASPAGGTMGGVARRTRDAMIACEAAGFDVVLIETVGVGQSEIAVADMADLVMLLVQPGGGDELQGIKRGVVEIADLVVVAKADGALAEQAAHTQADFAAALALRGEEEPWTPRAMACSAVEGQGLDEVWAAVERYRAVMAQGGALEAKRAGQARAWLWREVEESLIAALRADRRLAPAASALEAQAAAGEMTPAAAARRIVARFLDRSAKDAG